MSALNCDGRTNWIADAHRRDGTHLIVRADKKAEGLELDEDSKRFVDHFRFGCVQSWILSRLRKNK